MLQKSFSDKKDVNAGTIMCDSVEMLHAKRRTSHQYFEFSESGLKEVLVMWHTLKNLPKQLTLFGVWAWTADIDEQIQHYAYQ
ncbi:unnamed protein product [Caenorhabditis brenneri]